MIGKVVEITKKWSCGAEEYMDELVPAIWVEVPRKNETIRVFLEDNIHKVGDTIKVSWFRVMLSKFLKDI